MPSPRRKTARQPDAIPCCWHALSVPFGLGQRQDGQPVRIAHGQVCCRHGEAKGVFTGPAELGHGPFVSFVPDPRPAAGQIIVPGKIGHG